MNSIKKMFMWVVLGALAGVFISGALGVWVNNLNKLKNSSLNQGLENAQETDLSLALPLEQKLRNAIYDCEYNSNQCAQKIQDICDSLLDLLQDVGKVSYIEVKDKPCFVIYHNPVTNERFFYYERDLNKDAEPEWLERTAKIVTKYQQQIELLQTQREMFQQLVDSHNENINRINGIKNQNEQWQKISEHEEKVKALRGENDLEKNAIYNELVLKEIDEELNYQEECLQQYSLLRNKYQEAIDEESTYKYKLEIKEIISQLENKDPLH